MDWMHCNACLLQGKSTYYITSCGHILCQACITQDYCSVCRTASKYLPISENAWTFQKQQHEIHLMFYKQYISRSQKSLQVALQKTDSQENELKTLKKENAELRSLVSHLKGSLSRSQSSSRSCTPRPVAITSPSQTVTPWPNSHFCGQVVSLPSSGESYVRSHSGTGSQPTSVNRLQDRNTPLSSSQGSPLSGQSVSYRLPSQPTSNQNFSYAGVRSTISGSQTQARTDSNTLRGSSAVTRETCITPSTNIDRLRAIQLTFTPKMPGSQRSRT
ncbi:RING finger protein 212B isoform X2 [Pseudophryne corroboree]|uniref:RING finger protein 212B isoform X2 n=1 Tax=Pseudophryne corroboree TaxID=495146 RepID=UPI003081F1B2